MSNIRLDWQDPVVREDRSPLTAADIARIEISMRVLGAPAFTQLGSVAAGIQTFTQTDLPPGDYEFQLLVVDRQVPARTSSLVVVAANVPAPGKAAPGPVTAVAVTVTP